MSEAEEGGALPPMEPRFVNKGLRAPAKCPKDPQAYLQRTTHPYSPFVGNALTWESYVYDDGTTYEGLCREEAPHGKGLLTMGYGSGGGIQKTSMGDVYEGEFQAGFAHGLGQYTSYKSQEIYRGEFYAGKRQGCGMVINIGPYLRLVKQGESPGEAWQKAKDKIFSRAKYGTWKKDYFVAEPDEKGKRYCHINEIKGTLEELNAVLTQTRMFQWKPDGEVTFLFAQDGEGKPLNLFQDPLHYPFGTKFMAPGPLGQCYNIPENQALKEEMSLHAENYRKIHDMYNLDYDPPPGSDLYKALKLKAAKERAKKKLEEEKRARSASARFRSGRDGKGRKDGKKKKTAPPASVTVGLAKGFENAVANLRDGLASLNVHPRLTRPLTARR